MAPGQYTIPEETWSTNWWTEDRVNVLAAMATGSAIILLLWVVIWKSGPEITSSYAPEAASASAAGRAKSTKSQSTTSAPIVAGGTSGSSARSRPAERIRRGSSAGSNDMSKIYGRPRDDDSEHGYRMRKGYRKGQKFQGKSVEKGVGLAPLLFGPLHFIYDLEKDECYVEFDEGALYGKRKLTREQATALTYWLLKMRDMLGRKGQSRTK